jgi:regulation of enolase protein 1 (concanavalin A-like superfamily)
LGVLAGLPAAILVAFPTGDMQAVNVAEHQPAAFASMEGLFDTEEGAALVLKPAGSSDFWQRTHYGFQADNGSLLYAEADYDFRMETRVRLSPRHQYDQAGLMVRISPDCWIKTSVEHETDQPSVLGAVVTNGGFSDWSTQEFQGDTVELRVDRAGADYLVYWRELDQRWQQLRVCHLHGDDGKTPVLAGLYACCPKQAGLIASFEYLTLEPAPG